MILSGLPLGFLQQQKIHKSSGIWDSGKPTLLWTMTQGANFKHADWSISSISQSRGWGSFSLPVSLLVFVIAYCLILQLAFFFLIHPLFPPSQFHFGADKSGMLSSVSGPMCLDTEPQS